MHLMNYKNTYIAIILCFILSFIGWVMIFSSSFYQIAFLHKAEINILKPLFVRTAVSIMGFLIFFLIPKKFWQKYSFFILIACFVLLISVFISGVERHGAKRWIDFKIIQVQPFEIFKPLYLAYLSAYFYKHREYVWITKRWVFLIFVPFIFFILVALEPNFASAISIIFVTFVLFFIRGIPIKSILKSAVVASILFALLLFMGKNTFASHVFKRVERKIKTEEEHPQVIQAKIAIISGGFTGKGIGKGKIKYLYLPELSKDFIFSLLCEETGVIGALALLSIYLFVIISLLKTSFSHPDLFTSTYTAGFAIFLSYYVIVHTGVNMGILPPTGLPLPFISFGGSSLLSNFMALGIIMRCLKEKDELLIEKPNREKVIML